MITAGFPSDQIQAIAFNDDTVQHEFITSFQSGTLSPEKKIMFAVLQGAVRDLASNRMREDARRWIRDDSENWTFSFVNVCEVLGIEPASARRVLLSEKCVRLSLRANKVQPVRGAPAIGKPRRKMKRGRPPGSDFGWTGRAHITRPVESRLKVRQDGKPRNGCHHPGTFVWRGEWKTKSQGWQHGTWRTCESCLARKGKKVSA